MKIHFCFFAFLTTSILIHDAQATNLLTNGDFETGNLDSWSTDWTPIESGALCSTTAARGSGYGLWIYTDDGSSEEAFSSIYQDIQAAAGDIATASAYIRTPPPGQWVDWVAGSYACVTVSFLSAGGAILASYDSPHLTTGNTPYGTPYTVTTPPSPSGTASVRNTTIRKE